jgi:hypothetical protein
VALAVVHDLARRAPRLALTSSPRSRPTRWPGRRGPGRQHHRRRGDPPGAGQGMAGPAAADDAARRRGRLLRAGAAQRGQGHQAGPGAGAENLLPVPGAAARRRDSPADRAHRGVPVDEINRPRGSRDAALRIPPSEAQVGMLFARWRGDLRPEDAAVLSGPAGGARRRSYIRRTGADTSKPQCCHRHGFSAGLTRPPRSVTHSAAWPSQPNLGRMFST